MLEALQPIGRQVTNLRVNSRKFVEKVRPTIYDLVRPDVPMEWLEDNAVGYTILIETSFFGALGGIAVNMLNSAAQYFANSSFEYIGSHPTQVIGAGAVLATSGMAYRFIFHRPNTV